jgi:2,3-bisphosphoglycerate-dependent phosphoglycerate mutase
MALRVTFIRHGQTACNADANRHQVATTPLSPAGEDQARRLARQLGAERLKPAVIYSSDLSRALTTAQILAGTIDAPIVIDPLLREIDVGVFKGMLMSDAEALHPEVYRRWREGDCDAVCPEGECGRDVEKRAETFLSKVSRSHDDGHVVAVTHGRFIHALAMHVLRIPSPLQLRLATPNTGRFVFERSRSGHWDLITWADTHHLTPGTTTPAGPGM